MSQNRIVCRMESLQFTRGECVEEGFYASQAADGTIFFVKSAALFDGAIYVTYNGEKVYASSDSWDGQIKSYACHKNDLFFRTKNYATEEEKIYRATFHAPSEIRVEFVRDIEKNEEGHDNMMLIRTDKDGKEFARNAWDEKEVEVDADIQWALLVAVNRGKLISTRNKNEGGPSVREKSRNTILIEKDGYGSGEYCDSTSPIVYVCTEWKEMTVVNLETMGHRSVEMGEPIERDSIYSIVGVHDGKMTVLGEWEKKSWLYTAELPHSIREFENGKVAMYL